MKLALLLSASMLLAQSPAPTGQGYDVTQATGDHDFFFSFRQQAQAVLSYAPDNSLSEWQRLPFTWKLFGKDVTGYFVSDNGYLTFDPAAKASVGASTTLPHAAAPRGSIFAFWTDLHMSGGTGPWTNTAYAATFGAAPNRTHVVYWLSMVPKGRTFPGDALSFAVALHEGGGFEVIYTAARKTAAVAGTVGATSLDGAMHILAAGPAFDFPNVGFGGDDDRSFVFKSR